MTSYLSKSEPWKRNKNAINFKKKFFISLEKVLKRNDKLSFLGTWDFSELEAQGWKKIEVSNSFLVQSDLDDQPVIDDLFKAFCPNLIKNSTSAQR